MLWLFLPHEASNEGTGTQTYISQARQRGMFGAAVETSTQSVWLSWLRQIPNKIWPTKSNQYIPVRASCSRPRHTVSVSFARLRVSQAC